MRAHRKSGRTARSPEDRYEVDATPRPTRGRGTRTYSAAQGPCRRRRNWRCRRRRASPGPAIHPPSPCPEAGHAHQELPVVATGLAGTDNRPQPVGPAGFPRRSGIRSHPRKVLDLKDDLPSRPRLVCARYLDNLPGLSRGRPPEAWCQLLDPWQAGMADARVRTGALSTSRKGVPANGDTRRMTTYGGIVGRRSTPAARAIGPGRVSANTRSPANSDPRAPQHRCKPAPLRPG